MTNQGARKNENCLIDKDNSIFVSDSRNLLKPLISILIIIGKKIKKNDEKIYKRIYISRNIKLI